ncbi:shikimate 5-dehydrogenase [Microcystis sp.]|uniref:shikimate 5-dehydrogenase n=1 Tax=Microcystis sp. TaxID=1127 RepID=UPI0039192313
MTQTGETVTYSLESVLTRIEGKIDNFQRDVNQKFDTLQKDVNDLKIETTEIKGDIKTLDQKVEAMDKRLEKVEDSYAILVKDIADLKGFKYLVTNLLSAKGGFVNTYEVIDERKIP